MKIGIVGAGLTGSVIARTLSDYGCEVDVYTDDHPEAGSNAAACLVRPSWLEYMGGEGEIGREVLRGLCPPTELRFKSAAGHAKVEWYPRSKLLFIGGASRRRMKVVSVGTNGRVTYAPRGMAYHHAHYDTVIVAAGAWSNDVLPLELALPGLTAKVGMALEYPCEIAEPTITLRAPFKHCSAFVNGPNSTWFSDSTALTLDSWDRYRIERIRAAQTRAESKPFKLTGAPRLLVGHRPFVEGHRAGLVKRLSGKLWVATGGGKNGAVFAGFAAHLLREELI